MFKQENFQTQKLIFFYYCASYQEPVHYCTMKKCHIDYDRNNKVIIEAETEAAAQRKGNEDICGALIGITSFKNVMEMDIEHRSDSVIWKEEMERNRNWENKKERYEIIVETLESFGIERTVIWKMKTSLETEVVNEFVDLVKGDKEWKST